LNLHKNEIINSLLTKRPVIDTDANILGFKYVGIMASNCMGEVIRCAKVGADEGIDMNMIVDGELCHFTKRD